MVTCQTFAVIQPWAARSEPARTSENVHKGVLAACLAEAEPKGEEPDVFLPESSPQRGGDWGRFLELRLIAPGSKHLQRVHHPLSTPLVPRPWRHLTVKCTLIETSGIHRICTASAEKKKVGSQARKGNSLEGDERVPGPEGEAAPSLSDRVFLMPHQ